MASTAIIVNDILHKRIFMMEEVFLQREISINREFDQYLLKISLDLCIISAMIHPRTSIIG